MKSQIPFKPRLSGPYLEKLHRLFNLLADIETGHERAQCLNEFIEQINVDVLDDLKLKGILLFLRDLFLQGWNMDIKEGTPFLSHPDQPKGNNNKEWYRLALLKERNKQLENSTVQNFIKKMEKVNSKSGKSIASIIADPLELVKRIEQAGSSAIKPYMQIINSHTDKDLSTGFRLLDIWRYFRLTWSLPYKPTPGRNIFILVRDAGHENHPIMGIAALGSSIVQITCRDDNIGWTIESLKKRIKENDDDEFATKILSNASYFLEKAIQEIKYDDLLSYQDIEQPSKNAIELLQRIAAEGKDSEAPERIKADASLDDWREYSLTPFYRKKRASTLALLLKAKLTLSKVSDCKSSREILSKLLSNHEGRSALSTAINANKRDKVGANMMDIIVCGAIPPYNHLLAGKLVSLLMLSPQLSRAYKERYANHVSLIASGMKGEPVIKDSNLVYLGTTSLYETGSSQYNRLTFSAKSIDSNAPDMEIGYYVHGLTKGFGTVYISDETVDSLSKLIKEFYGRRIVTNKFGEGTSPRLRLIKAALEIIGLNSEQLVRHNFKRIVYGVNLATNAFEFLRGEHKRPEYYFNQDTPELVTEMICEYWRKRWFEMRIKNETVIGKVKQFKKENFMLGSKSMH